jgi:hypothetical protein
VGRRSHLGAAPHILYGESLLKYTKRCLSGSPPPAAAKVSDLAGYTRRVRELLQTVQAEAADAQRQERREYPWAVE